MAIGKRTEGYAGSGHQSTTDDAAVVFLVAEVPEHSHGAIEITYICREKAGGGGDRLIQTGNYAIYRDGASATFDGFMDNSTAQADIKSNGHCVFPTIDCSGTYVRVSTTGVAGHNLEHSVFARWLALAEYTT